MPRKAIATAAGLVALFIEGDGLGGEATWAALAALVAYLVCHTVTDIAGIIFGSKEAGK